jgi:hypothetical protein
MYETPVSSAQQLGLTIPGEAAGDQSGWSVSLNSTGTIVAVGAITNDGTVVNSNRGHVKVYQLSGNSWSQLGSDIDGEASGDYSGWSVSLSDDGTRLAVGAIYNDGTVANSNRGHVKVYQLSGNVWSILGSDIDGKATGDCSGWSVSLNSTGSRIAIGAIYNDNVNGTNSGHTVIYDLVGSTWTQIGEIFGDSNFAYSGYSVSLNSTGDRLAIGSASNNSGKTTVYSYNQLTTTWSVLGASIVGDKVGDNSGYSVSLNSAGNRLAVGAPYNDSNGLDCGVTKVYEYISGSWTQLGKSIYGSTPGDYSGWSVSLNSLGDRVAISSIQNFRTGTTSIYDYVLIDVAEYDWQKLIYNIDGIDINDYSSYSVSISNTGDRIAIGAIGDNGTGSVSVYDLQVASVLTTTTTTTTTSSTTTSTTSTTTTTTQPPEQFLPLATTIGKYILDETPDSKFGVSLSLNSAGNYIAVGSPGTNINRGQTKVYREDNDNWYQIGQDINGEEAGDQSGCSVAINGLGDRVAIAAITNRGGNNNAGHVRVYEFFENLWVPVGTDIDGKLAEENTGWSLSLNKAGDRIAISSINSNTNKGHTRVYHLLGENWIQLGTDIVGNASNDYSGWSICMDNTGNRIAISSIYADNGTSNIGCTRIYKWSGTAWTQLGADIIGESEGDCSGWSVSLSGDGNTIAIGAIYNDNTNGLNSGQTRVYRWNNTSWAPLGGDIDGEASGDYSGWSVSLNDSGTRLAIGSIWNSSGGTRSGEVRVYALFGNTWSKIIQDISGTNDSWLGYSVALNSTGERVAASTGNGDKVYVYTLPPTPPTTPPPPTTLPPVIPPTNIDLSDIDIFELDDRGRLRDRFLYFQFDGNNEAIYTGEPLACDIKHIFRVVNTGNTQQTMSGGRLYIPYVIEFIPIQEVTINIDYSRVVDRNYTVPIDVGRYEVNITLTWIDTSNNITYKGFFTSNYFAGKPGDIPDQDDEVYSSKFRADVNKSLYPEKIKNPFKPLIIKPAPATINFTTTTKTYNGFSEPPEYETIPSGLPVRLMYTGTLAPLAAPIEVGTYSVAADILNFNYVGTASTQYTITKETTAEAAAKEEENKEKLSILETFKDQVDEYITPTKILDILDKNDVIDIAEIKSLADCARTLPQRLLMAVGMKLLTMVAAYVPGLGILNLLNTALQLMQRIQKILELIEMIRKNPLGFLDAVLAASGAYTAIGNTFNSAVSSIKEQFPDASAAVGDVAEFTKGVYTKAVDFCKATDNFGNPLSNIVKADITKVPAMVAGFLPANTRMPVQQKIGYDYFMFQIKEALEKDNDVIKKFQDSKDEVALREYITMITAVNELAYNYHDKIAATANPKGLLDIPYNAESGRSETLDEIIGTVSGVSSLVGSLNSLNSSTATTTPSNNNSSGSASNNSSKGIISSLNTGLTSIAGGIDTVTSAIGVATNYLTGSAFSIAPFKSEFNTAVKETLAKNPTWSAATVKEFNRRVNRIKFEIESGADSIRNNPAFARTASISTDATTTTAPPKAIVVKE